MAERRALTYLERQCLEAGWSLGLDVEDTDSGVVATVIVEGSEPFLPVRVKKGEKYGIDAINLAAIFAWQEIDRRQRGDGSAGVREPRRPRPMGGLTQADAGESS